MTGQRAPYGAMDAKIEAERTRLVRALRDLADRIERAPLDRLSGALTFIASLVEQLAARGEQMFGKRPGSSQ
jgi:hypothetical protein